MIVELILKIVMSVRSDKELTFSINPMRVRRSKLLYKYNNRSIRIDSLGQVHYITHFAIFAKPTSSILLYAYCKPEDKQKTMEALSAAFLEDWKKIEANFNAIQGHILNGQIVGVKVIDGPEELIDPPKDIRL